jgi:hypothetical protein
MTADCHRSCVLHCHTSSLQHETVPVTGGVRDKVTFRCQDATESDLARATVVFMYLIPSGIAALKPQLETLRPGTRVASYIFKIPYWHPNSSSVADLKVPDIPSRSADQSGASQSCNSCTATRCSPAQCGSGHLPYACCLTPGQVHVKSLSIEISSTVLPCPDNPSSRLLVSAEPEVPHGNSHIHKKTRPSATIGKLLEVVAVPKPGRSSQGSLEHSRIFVYEVVEQKPGGQVSTEGPGSMDGLIDSAIVAHQAAEPFFGGAEPGADEGPYNRNTVKASHGEFPPASAVLQAQDAGSPWPWESTQKNKSLEWRVQEGIFGTSVASGRTNGIEQSKQRVVADAEAVNQLTRERRSAHVSQKDVSWPPQEGEADWSAIWVLRLAALVFIGSYVVLRVCNRL